MNDAFSEARKDGGARDLARFADTAEGTVLGERGFPLRGFR